jgi:hypothetical protein
MRESSAPLPDPFGDRPPPRPPTRTAVGTATPGDDGPGRGDLAVVVPTSSRQLRTRDGLGFTIGLLLGGAGAGGGSVLTQFAGGAALLVPTVLALGGAAVGIWVMRTGIRTVPPPGPSRRAGATSTAA